MLIGSTQVLQGHCPLVLHPVSGERLPGRVLLRGFLGRRRRLPAAALLGQAEARRRRLPHRRRQRRRRDLLGRKG